MLDMGFLPDVRRIIAALPARRQTLLYSATLSPRILQLAGEILRDPVTVMLDPQEPAKGIEQSMYNVAQANKAALLTSLLRRSEMRSVLVFVRRKVDADRLARAVTRSGVNATSLHSDRSQEERTAALEAFRRGECPVLVATDVAGRGTRCQRHLARNQLRRAALSGRLHPPRRPHRTGRSHGNVITFVAPDEESGLARIQAELGVALRRATLTDGDAAPALVGRPSIDRRRGRRPNRRRAAPSRQPALPAEPSHPDPPHPGAASRSPSAAVRIANDLDLLEGDQPTAAGGEHHRVELRQEGPYRGFAVDDLDDHRQVFPTGAGSWRCG
jgi:ATP-dependent RNA helicase RhlE